MRKSINKEELKEKILKYVSLCSSYKEIASYCGVHFHSIRKTINYYGMKNEIKKTMKPKKRTSVPWNKGLNKNTDERIKKVGLARIGENNPMYGKKPWNTGLTSNTNELVKLVAEKRRGRKATNEHKMHMSESALRRKIHGMQGKHHSKETREKLSKITIKQLNEGRFPQTNSRPHQAVKNFLNSQGIKYEEEVPLDTFAVDFMLNNGLIIEVQGDYWHSNPKYYPEGPKTLGQKINAYRDKKKHECFVKNNCKFIYVWEDEVNNQTFMEKILNAISSS